MKGRFGWVLWSPPHRPFSVSGSFSRTWRPEQLLQLAVLEHLHHDVGAADELALDVELRDCRPVAIFLDALADLRVLENIDGLVFGFEPIQNRDCAARKAALREQRRSL